MSKLKASDVGFTEVTYKPVAECSDTNCNWKCLDATPKDCRDHVIQTGHTVSKVRRSDAQYYVR